MQILAEHAPVRHAGISETPSRENAHSGRQPNRLMPWAGILSLLLHGGLFMITPPAQRHQEPLPLPREIFVTLTAVQDEKPQPPPQGSVSEPAQKKEQVNTLSARRKTVVKQTQPAPEPVATEPPQAMPALASDSPAAASDDVPAEAALEAGLATGAAPARNPGETGQGEEKPVDVAHATPTGSGSGASEETGIEASPLYQKNPPPDYPPLARKRGLEGTVELDVLVTRDGSVRQVRLGQTSGHALLDGAAVSAVEKWFFQPGQKGNETIDMWVCVPIRFALRNENRQDKP